MRDHKEYEIKVSRETLFSYMDDETNAAIVIKELLPLSPNAHLETLKKMEFQVFFFNMVDGWEWSCLVPEQLRWKRF